jgi:hypothetical protein
MIVVRIEAANARGNITEIARLEIVNDGTGSPLVGFYDGRAFHGPGFDPRSLPHAAPAELELREGRVINYPRKRAHVLNLVAAMLHAMGYPSRLS